jgi:hypothetical protein
MNNKKIEKQLKKKSLYETAVFEKKKEKNDEKLTRIKNRMHDNMRDFNEKLKQLNIDNKKKDHIKNELVNRIENDKLTLKEINKLRQEDVNENLKFERNKLLSVKA